MQNPRKTRKFTPSKNTSYTVIRTRMKYLITFLLSSVGDTELNLTLKQGKGGDMEESSNNWII